MNIEYKRPIDPVRQMALSILPRCTVDTLPDMDEATYRKAKVTEAVLQQVANSSWVHGWMNSEGKLGQFQAGAPAYIGGMGANEMMTPYIDIRLPKEPREFIVSLTRYLDSNGEEKPAVEDTLEDLLDPEGAEKSKTA